MPGAESDLERMFLKRRLLPPPPPDPAPIEAELSFGRKPPINPSGYGPADVFGLKDGRDPIRNTARRPWRWICALFSREGGRRRLAGTAFLVGPRLALTAGHCLDLRLGHLEIVPGCGPGERPFGAQIVPKARWRYHPEYVSDPETGEGEGTPARDAGALLLERPFEGLGWLEAAAPEAKEIVGLRADIAGYPEQGPNAREAPEEQLYVSRNVIKAATARALSYAMDATGGQSGSPIWARASRTGPCVVIGIHAYGEGGDPEAAPGKLNSAVRIDADLGGFIRRWEEESRG